MIAICQWRADLLTGDAERISDFRGGHNCKIVRKNKLFSIVDFNSEKRALRLIGENSEYIQKCQ